MKNLLIINHKYLLIIINDLKSRRKINLKIRENEIENLNSSKSMRNLNVNTNDLNKKQRKNKTLSFKMK